jgi:hypothetical protein
MELNQVLESQLTQEEVGMMSELLRSDNAPKILFLMMRTFASRSDENVKFLMSTISELANATIDRANTSVLKKQKTIETLEAIIPPNMDEYPYGYAGALIYVMSQCNFKDLYDPEHPYLALASRYMIGSPVGRLMIPKFKEFIDLGDELWKDGAWLCIDLLGFGDECRELVKWCIGNRGKWDDAATYRPVIVVRTQKRTYRKKGGTNA